MLKAFVAFICFFSMTAFGQVVDVPPFDAFQVMLDLIKNWSTMTPLAVGMSLVIVIVQLLKKFAVDFKYSRLAVTVLSVLYSVLLSYTNGLNWLDAAISALIVGGGAVAIYEAFKGMNKLVESKSK